MKPAIEHVVDLVEIDGEIEQVYNYLFYRWEEPSVSARAYLDEPATVSILSGEPSSEILDYLRDRYARIQRLGRQGYYVVEVAG